MTDIRTRSRPKGPAAPREQAAPAPPRAAAAPPELEEVRLVGQPTLARYLDFVESMVKDGAAMPQRALCEEWRRANDDYYALETSEAGIAETVGCEPLDPALVPLVEEVEADPRFRATFPHLPWTFGMVELDKLVVYQQGITRSWAHDVARRIGPDPDAATVFRYCQQLSTPTPPVTIEATDDDRFVFSSPAPHLTFHEAVLLRPEQVPGYGSFGPVAGIVALVIGFRGNFLNAIRADGRILLNNGYHRAYALRALGVTHAPCVIQDVTRLDELDLCAPERVSDDPRFYFRSKRPPLLKDFFDPRLSRDFRMRPRRRAVEVDYSIRKRYLME